ncbi:holo-ACP synthase [Microbacterium luticocti]|uniref:holo-ACP synthase n=1 Tax=Microbacterium luticocti TaxID=451764 RepID=UPI00146E514B|nr:4'-phosphopantetheinyl transferase superfamily protein [Microbacterium luticocti]
MADTGARATPAAIIAGVGVDLVAVDRWRRLVGGGIVRRWFDAVERDRCRAAPDPARAFAEVFAAKEAVFKALPLSGWTGAVPWRDIHIAPAGVRVDGALAAACAPAHVQVRVATTAGVAHAFAIAVSP